MPGSGLTDKTEAFPVSAGARKAAPSSPEPLLPEVRQVNPGETHLLCRCGRSPRLPDCPVDCTAGLRLEPARQQFLLLCRCGRSRQLPYCDGRHARPAPGLAARWRRFWSGR
ncbi:CDGSH iron-sulfur domain-containing protein [Pseudomonas xionganensis]|uniref:CDGSH iron-sulfur domain-containing protein n=1 Tax=Pseudomonas xionganensis TaxID=2654845 RepID=A0A6I4KSU3_9PSED|nr:CDGSH iron-sulfur domain-containing protein [Pseudomonas xionganensis]MVW75164.1 CDGSH iron-sulfur domain-containing protein [Pseudomonas xionganensis]